MASLLTILFLLISVFCTRSLNAAHIVGGDMTYRFITFNMDTTQVTYEIVVTLYRDSRSMGAQFDDATTTAFGVWRELPQGGWTLYRDIRGINPLNIRDVPPNDDPCVEEPIDEIAVEQGNYIFQVTLDISDRNYMIAYQRCCRNESINNLINPGETGAVFDVIISPEAQISGNSSPTFGPAQDPIYPPIFICAGFPISVDQSAIDADGDELRYTFCTPFTAGGDTDSQQGTGNGQAGCCTCVRPDPNRCPPDFDNVNFAPPYNGTQPLQGNPVVNIDNITGLITGTPETTGQFVVGVCVEEFRGGVSLGKIRRDFQFNVLECDKAVNARLAADEEIPQAGNNLYVINSCGDSTITIENLSTDINFIQTYDWKFFDSNNSLIQEVSGGLEARNADITFPGLGTYNGRLLLNADLQCADSAEFVVNFYPSINADFMPDYDTCVAGPVAFMDQSVTGSDTLTSWAWDFGDGVTSDLPNPEHLFAEPGVMNVQLTVVDKNECVDVIDKSVVYQPAPATIIVEPSSFIGCVPSTIFLNNLSAPIDSTYDILWDLGDGNFSSEISPTHEYLSSGNFNLSLEIVSPIGCEITRGFNNLIRIKDAPVADFSCSPDVLTIFNRTASFTDLSIDANAWQWDFGGEATIFDQNPSYTFPDTGVYRVTLTAFHPITDCPDTISKLIDVIPVVNFYFPNAFTPNDDTSNDVFLGNGYYQGLVDYEISIWNRWGQMVFSSNEPTEGWNGQEFNTGAHSPQGVYVYKARYKDPRGEARQVKGHVTLIR